MRSGRWRCCGFWSYALSAQNLQALCGIHLSPTVVGKIADEVGGDIATLLPDNAAIRERFQKAVQSWLDYLGKNKERLRYAERLAAGRNIGSGLIEGACKNLVKRRLKQTGACWRVPKANRIAVICATLYSDQWDDCWKKYH